MMTPIIIHSHSGGYSSSSHHRIGLIVWRIKGKEARIWEEGKRKKLIFVSNLRINFWLIVGSRTISFYFSFSGEITMGFVCKIKEKCSTTCWLFHRTLRGFRELFNFLYTFCWVLLLVLLSSDLASFVPKLSKYGFKVSNLKWRSRRNGMSDSITGGVKR